MALALLSVPLAQAASPNSLAGDILGQVKSASGVAQMGATVYLYNRYDEVVRKSLTSQDGRFVFDGLAPDLYSVRVILASFIPAERHNISVLASSENRLEISLASVLSTVGLTSTPASPGTLMTDDWKWVLRTSQATRPVLRFLPDPAARASSSAHGAPFSNTMGVLSLSAGDGKSFARGAQQDLGTAFGVATSLPGAGRVQFAGNVGYAMDSSRPGAGFRTSYTRSETEGSNPEFVVTARQIYLAPRAGAGDSAPALRTLSTDLLDRVTVADNVTVDYGFSFQTVAYVDRLHNVSPFLRASFDSGKWGRVRTGFSAGATPTELLARDDAKEGSLDPDFVALASLPQLARTGGRLTLQRTQSVEIAWDKRVGSMTYSAGAYQEAVSNAAFMLSAPVDFLPAADLMPDLSSRSSIFNAGSYQRTGYTAAVKQALGERLNITLAAGRSGGLLARAPNSSFSDSEDLRGGIRQRQRFWATMRLAGTVPGTGTRVSASYGWTDFNVLMPAHVFITQASNQDIGVNFDIRQPLPISGLPWRIEATANFRNMLAQGYLPLGGAGTRSVLTNSPRAVRGGLNFIF